MVRRTLCCAVAALALAPVALADGPIIGATQGWLGVASPQSGERFVAIDGNGQTTLEAIRMRDGAVLGYMQYRGFWGIPAVTYDGSTAGLSANGRVLVLENGYAGGPLRATSSFLVVNARQMTSERVLTLRGDLLVDALSPDGQMLYLIQHVESTDATRYVVRAYDLRTGRLLPLAIADRTQRGWVMRGLPVERVTSADGRWVYTLYENDGGYPFVHALDTVSATAHCVGLPWHGSQSGLSSWRMSLRGHGRVLAFVRPNGKTWWTMDRQTFRLSRPLAAGPSSSQLWLLLLLAPAIALLVAVRKKALRRLVASTGGWRTNVSSGWFGRFGLRSSARP